jgi:hypothetical protein
MTEAAISDLIPALKQSKTLDNCDINTKTKWQSDFIGSCSRYFGYVHTVNEAMAVMKQYELDTTTRFSCFKSSKDFGSTGKEEFAYYQIQYN